MMSLQKILLVIIFFVCISVFAQERKIKNDNQQWFQYYVKSKISNKFNLLTDAGFRTKDNFKLKSQYIIRAALSYNLYESINISTGIAHLGYYSNNQLNKMEYRPYQELMANNQYRKLNFSNRVRIEERIFNSYLTGVNTVIRYRYRLLLSYPVVIKEEKAKKILLNFGNEIFLNVTNQFYRNVFDQNRILAGITYFINNETIIDLMYNYQNKSLNKDNEYQHDNILWLGIKQNLKLKKN